MSDLIISTVGTSFIGNLRASFDSKPNWQRAAQHLKGLDPTERGAGAEVNSISYILAGRGLSGGPMTPPVDLVFLVSDTDEGRFMGRVLEKHYAQNPAIDKGEVSCDVIEGLVPDDPKRFARIGLRNLVKRTSHHLQQHPEGRRCINATGGFKAQISFAGLIGQTLGVPVLYAFEAFDCCVELPPMPVDFDRNLWLSHYGLFHLLSREHLATGDALRIDHVDPRLRKLLDWEEIDGLRCYSLSPMLELMHQGFLSRWPVQPKPPRNTDVHPEDRLDLNRSELPHDPPGTEQLARRLAELPWVDKVRNHTPRMNTTRTHVLPADPNEPATVALAYAHDAQPQGAVRLAVRTTASDEAEVLYVRQRLAELLAEES